MREQVKRKQKARMRKWQRRREGARRKEFEGVTRKKDGGRGRREGRRNGMSPPCKFFIGPHF